MSSDRKIALPNFILMILTSVFGVVNIGIGFFNMGYTAIPWYIIGGFLFFLPFIFMMVELATGFSQESGGIYTWMSKSVGVKFAFVGIMMWYASYVIWMFGKSLNMWVPFSVILFGKDLTGNIPQWVLGIMAVGVVLLIAFIVSLGAKKLSILSSIGGVAVIGMNVILLVGGVVALIMNGGFAEPINGVGSFVGRSPNPDFQSMAAMLGFLVYAVFAYGGVEAIAGTADEVENPKKNVKKGIVIAGTFVVTCYIFGYLMAGVAVTPEGLSTEGYNATSALYGIMYGLGDRLAGPELGDVFMRLSGLGMFLAYIGAFIALTYAPLKQLIGGTPKEFWPKSFQKRNAEGIATAAVKVQAFIVIIFISLKVFLTEIISHIQGSEEAAEEAVKNLFDNIISMSNIAMTLPYLFLIIAFFCYRQRDDLPKGMTIYKSQTMVKIVTFVTFFVVAFANIFSIIQPMVDAYFHQDGNWLAGLDQTVWIVAGPVVFGMLAIIIYERSKHKVPSNDDDGSDVALDVIVEVE